METGFYIEYKNKKKKSWVYIDEETKEILDVAKWVLPLLNHGYACEDIQAMLPDKKEQVPTAVNYIKDVFPKTVIPDYENNIEKKFWSWPRIREVQPIANEESDNDY